MKIGIDIGASLTKIVAIEGDEIIWKKCVETTENIDFDSLIPYDEISEIYITGGNPNTYPEKIKKIETRSFPEIEAMAKGVGVEDCLIVSMGTGTCIVDVKNGKSEHVGGTSMGGGTYRSLVGMMAGIDDFNEMEIEAKKGDLSKMDLSVKDIKGEGIGILNEDITASNLGKLKGKENLSKGDIILGVQNLIAESIFSTTFFASGQTGNKNVIFIGKMIEIQSIKEKIELLCSRFGLKMVVPKNPAFVTAMGTLK